MLSLLIYDIERWHLEYTHGTKLCSRNVGPMVICYVSINTRGHNPSECSSLCYTIEQNINLSNSNITSTVNHDLIKWFIHQQTNPLTLAFVYALLLFKLLMT